MDMCTTVEGLHVLTTDNGYEHYDSQEYAKHALEGCRLCEMVVENIKTIKYPERPTRWNAIVSGGSPGKEKNVLLDWKFVDSKRTPKLFGFKILYEGSYRSDDYDYDYDLITPSLLELIVFTEPGMQSNEKSFSRVGDTLTGCIDNLAFPHVRRELYVGAAGSPRVFKQAQKELRQCLSGGFPGTSRHPYCLRALPPELPTRVLDCQSEIISLYLPSQGEHGEYAALSYCWGASNHLITTKANLAEHVHTITPLPQTLQDAIITVRNLRLRYLWVDALCIIQDDFEDKQFEIARMGDIYKNATITIVASISASVNSGFVHCTPSKPDIVYIPLLLPGHDRFGMLGTSPLERKLIKEPLFSRGWALQELVLSRRSLIFGEEVRWDCTSTAGKPATTLLPSNTEYFVDGAYGWATQIWDRLDRLEKAWSGIAEEYSNRKLTFVEDRFVAIAAVAKEFIHWQRIGKWVPDYQGPEKDIDIPYFAGCFGTPELFIRNLCWYRKCDPDHSLPIHRLVTWSWISIGCPIKFLEGYTYSMAEVVLCSITSEPNNDPFGDITAAKLKLRGPLVSLNSDTYHNMFGCMPGVTMRLDSTSESFENNMIVADPEDWKASSLAFIRGQFGAECGNMFLFVLGWVNKLDDANFIMCCRGLVVEEFRKGHFRRLGLLSFSNPKNVWFSHDYGVDVQSRPWSWWYSRFDEIPRVEISLW